MAISSLPISVENKIQDRDLELRMSVELAHQRSMIELTLNQGYTVSEALQVIYNIDYLYFHTN